MRPRQMPNPHAWPPRDSGHGDQDRERSRNRLFRSNWRQVQNQLNLAHRSTSTPSADPSQLPAVNSSRSRLLRYQTISMCGRRGRVELIHRLVTASNLNSRDENDGIEKRPDQFDCAVDTFDTIVNRAGDRGGIPPRSPRMTNLPGCSAATAEDPAEEPTESRRSRILGVGGNHSRAACFVFQNGPELWRLCKPPLLIGAAICEVE